jgi:SOUL heme-binding protein
MTPQVLAQTPRSFGLPDNAPSGRDAKADGHVPIRRFWKTVATALLKRLARMLPTDWRILQWSKETDENIVASLGSVQIRHVPGGCLAQTCVKGDMNPARGTALLRLLKYVNGDNQRATRFDAERPLLQQRRAPGLWQVAVRLVAVDDVQAAPVPRARKIRIVAQEPTTWAVVTRHGRPTERAIERAEIAIMDTIAHSQWSAAGSATVRIHTPTAVLPFAGNFEVAVPVFSHAQDQSTGDGSRPRVGRATDSRPANPPGRPVH